MAQKIEYLFILSLFIISDNTPRRGREGIACVNTSLETFKLALDTLCNYTQENLPNNLQYVFLNAWNEWGEGCHLEPDVAHGRQYLQVIKEIAQKYS